MEVIWLELDQKSLAKETITRYLLIFITVSYFSIL